MHEITKRASASKGTLDAWFDDERSFVRRHHPAQCLSVLTQRFDEDASTELILSDVDRVLLEFLLGNSVMAINRAVISQAKSDPILAEILANS